MIMKKILIYTLTLLISGLVSSCDSFFDAKPTKDLDVPETIPALQALLDNSDNLNQDIAALLVMADEYNSTASGYLQIVDYLQQVAVWNPTPFLTEDIVFDFRGPYSSILISNIVLEQINLLERKDISWDYVKGTAQYFRANSYFNLAMAFLPHPSLETTVNSEFKIPLKLAPDFEFQPQLAGVEEIFNVIMEDLKAAIELLPSTTEFKTRPTKSAANALMARVALYLGDYERAFSSANEALIDRSMLLDYNDIDPNVSFPFTRFNEEVLCHSRMQNHSFIRNTESLVISERLLALYHKNDLRRDLFFIERPGGFFNFRGSYDNSQTLFTGPTTAEMYLIAAEAKIRLGDMSEGTRLLNTLSEKRFEAGTFEALEFTTLDDALGYVLEERERELVFRGLKWMDLKRIGSEGGQSGTISRRVGEELLTLDLSVGYTLPLPEREKSFY
jgi:tetratricopeptide (TPR) repeat protein